MGKETAHKTGEDGLDITQRFLESTTWIELPLNVYDNEAACSLQRLDGTFKAWDLVGFIHPMSATKQRPLFVENKALNAESGAQSGWYWEYLADAYSHTALNLKNKMDTRAEFMYVTKYPFDQGSWKELTSAARIMTAVTTKHPAALGEDKFDEKIARLLSERLWLIVLHDRQAELMLAASELAKIEAQLNRRGRKA
jgi:hypothetical protein